MSDPGASAALRLPSLSVVVPAWNEEDRIGDSLEVLGKALEAESWHDRSEVLVVDDGSSDGTADVVREYVAAGDGVRLVQQAERSGKGGAVRAGVEAATQEWVLIVDADLAIPFDEIEKLVPHTEAAPIVIGSKRSPGAVVHRSALRRFAGGFGQALIRWFAVRGFEDTQCGFKLMRRDVASRLLGHQRLTGFGYDFELLFLAKRLGYAVREVPVVCRDSGDGSVGLGSYVRTFGELARLVAGRVMGRYPRG